MNTTKRSLSGLAMSIIQLIIGVLLLVDPVGFTSGIIVACGIVLMLLGFRSIIKYFRTEPETAALNQSLVKGLVELLGGAFCALRSHWFIATFPVLTLVYGVAILITGLIKLQWMVDHIRMKRKRWFLAAISAAVSILCGAVIITSPFSTTAVLWMFTGISLILEAVLDTVTMLFGNKSEKESMEAVET